MEFKKDLAPNKDTMNTVHVGQIYGIWSKEAYAYYF